jgi:CBS domain-containing membrane protein
MRTVRDIIDPEPFWVPADMPLGRVAEELSEHQVGGAPVCSPDGRIVGMVSKTDLTELYGRADDDRRAQDAMTPEVLSVRADAPIEGAIRNMAFEGVHQLVVVDDDERFVGVVTSMDILRELAGYPRKPARVFAVAP